MVAAVLSLPMAGLRRRSVKRERTGEPDLEKRVGVQVENAFERE